MHSPRRNEAVVLPQLHWLPTTPRSPRPRLALVVSYDIVCTPAPLLRWVPLLLCSLELMLGLCAPVGGWKLGPEPAQLVSDAVGSWGQLHTKWYRHTGADAQILQVSWLRA